MKQLIKATNITIQHNSKNLITVHSFKECDQWMTDNNFGAVGYDVYGSTAYVYVQRKNAEYNRRLKIAGGIK